jgi:hypothetical protein
MDGEPTSPAGSRRARIALLVAGVAVLLATTARVGVALGVAGQRPRAVSQCPSRLCAHDAVVDKPSIPNSCRTEGA